MKKNSCYWYCPKCKEELDGCHVTYQELCEYCGTAVFSVSENISQGKLEEIIEAEAEGRIAPVKCPCDASKEAQELMNAKADDWWNRPLQPATTPVKIILPDLDIFMEMLTAYQELHPDHSLKKAIYETNWHYLIHYSKKTA